MATPKSQTTTAGKSRKTTAAKPKTMKAAAGHTGGGTTAPKRPAAKAKRTTGTPK